jgi:peptidyl-prolyl cis-trans isomerase SurA
MVSNILRRPANRLARLHPVGALLLSAALLLPAAAVQAQGRPAAAAPAPAARNGDWIAAVVNQEAVTAGEIDRRIERAIAEAARSGARLPPEAELRQQAMDSLIDERVIVTSARDSGMKVDEPDIDRAVQTVAAQNQLSVEVLRQRLAAEGIDYGRFRANLRDQILMERMREREVYQRIRVSDEDIDKALVERRAQALAEAPVNLAQILVTVPEGASEAQLAERRARAAAALARVRAGEDFATVARELSEDGNRAAGGVIGLRPPNRLPDVFAAAIKTLVPGELTPELVRSGAGFHVLKLLERQDSAEKIVQTRSRHILLRPSAANGALAIEQRMREYRARIEAGTLAFDDAARQFSEDGSAAQGGDLGWMSPGMLVPEFEQAMNALAVNGVSEPVTSRFGVHLIQVLERREVPVDPKQLREQARNLLREQRFEQAYLDWTKELRSRAYVELREPPL